MGPRKTKQKSTKAKEILARAYTYRASQKWDIILKFRLRNALSFKLEYRAPTSGNQIKLENRLGIK